VPGAAGLDHYETFAAAIAGEARRLGAPRDGDDLAFLAGEVEEPGDVIGNLGASQRSFQALSKL